MERRVVVTGLGAVSPIGNDVKTLFESIKKCKCGVDYITKFDTTDFKVKLAAEVKNFDPTKVLEPNELRRTDLFSQFALCAAAEAVQDSNFLLQYPEDRVGVFVGSGIGGITSLQNEIFKLKDSGPKKVSPFIVPLMIINIVSGLISIKYKAKGESLPVVSACSTGSHAIGEAYRAIKHGYVDAVIAGGSEASITEISVAGFTNISALSKSEDISRASIPFDKERSGFVMGEGAGIVVLEEMESAIRRGAKIYCEICGYGNTCDAYHITAPAPDADQISRAMAIALQESCYKRTDKVYINAHGTSTKLNDYSETIAIKKLFGEDSIKNVCVSSTKSMTGHMLGAAGAVEFVISVKALVDKILPPTINYKVKDEALDLDYIANCPRSSNVDIVLSNSLGFGGHNVSLAIRCLK